MLDVMFTNTKRNILPKQAPEIVSGLSYGNEANPSCSNDSFPLQKVSLQVFVLISAKIK